MNIPNFLQGIVRIGIDTAPIIYLVERHPKYLEVVREVFRLIDEGYMLGYSSVITLTETLCRPVGVGDTQLIDEYIDILYNAQNFHLISISAEIARHAAELRSRYGLRTPDALQISALISVGCDGLLTNDLRMRAIKELRVLILDDLVEGGS